MQGCCSHRRGRLAWRSDLDERRGDLDTALQQIVEGSHDLDSLAQLDERREETRRGAQPLLRAAEKARARGEFAEPKRVLP